MSENVELRKCHGNEPDVVSGHSMMDGFYLELYCPACWVTTKEWPTTDAGRAAMIAEWNALEPREIVDSDQ